MAHVDDQGAQVHATRAHEGAFAAEHAFAQLLGEFVVLSAPEGVMDFTDVEIRELAGRTGRRTAAAADTFPVGGNLFQQTVRLS